MADELRSVLLGCGAVIAGFSAVGVLHDKLPHTRPSMSIQYSCGQCVPSGLPVNGEITSEFGERQDPFNPRKTQNHEGVDIKCPPGSDVTSTIDGVVVAANSKTGKLEIANDQYKIVLQHNSGLYVDIGDRIKQGQRVALSGSKGRATGPHEHYETHMRGRNGGFYAMNPLNLKFKKYDSQHR